ncbi:hypothetical protein, partial [Acidovorax sp. SRB_14]|uniref:hypothetical protein n=1 Tax=Acidovorax sp. SRB_14 TaxID=1962699 RepID=UPI001C20A7F3
WLEYRPVTPGVAGSSPVHSARVCRFLGGAQRFFARRDRDSQVEFKAATVHTVAAFVFSGQASQDVSEICGRRTAQ